MTNNLSRVTAKIFAGNAPLDAIGQFGSALAGTKVNTQDVTQLQALPAYEDGWSEAVISDRNYPTLEEMNGVMNVMSYQTAYGMQKGIPEWDSGTNYYANTSFCQVNGTWYQSLIDNNIGNNPATSPNAWEEIPLNNTANQDLSNLTPEGEKHFLNKSQITNAILDAPRMVDVELLDGAIVLKAGARVIVPYGTLAPAMEIGDSLNGGVIVDISWDGSKLFYIIEYASDKSYSDGATPTITTNMYVTPSGGFASSSAAYSGSALPSGSSFLWYDTANNIVHSYSQNTLTYSYVSLPVCQASIVSGAFVSINKTFQSIGYIGTTTWINKGVKCLMPNGRNENQTLNNIEYTTQKVAVLDIVDLNRLSLIWLQNDGTLCNWGLSGGNVCYYKTRPLSAPQIFVVAYIEDENKWIMTNGTTLNWMDCPLPRCPIALHATDNSQIINSITKETFHALDYNDMTMGLIPTVIEAYRNGSSGYNLYSNGYCEQWGRSTSTSVVYLKNFKDTNYNLQVSPHINSNTTTYWSDFGHSLTTSGFTLRMPSANPTDWFACGYIL